MNSRLWVGRGHGVRDPLGKHEQSRTGGSITITQNTEETPMYTSETAIYADSEGNVVPEDSPDAAIMVVAAGGTITDEEAAKYGLTDEGAKKPQAEEGEASKVADRPSPATDEMEDPLHVTAETVHGKGSSTAPTADDHPPATPKPAKK